MASAKINEACPGRDGALYLVTGAGGHLGGAVLRALSACGREARGLVRPGSRGGTPLPGVQYVSGDVRDPDSLRALFGNPQGRALVVIHTAALISIAEKMPPELYDVNVNGVKNILRLCRESGAERLVHVSSVHAIPELPRGQVMREVSSFSPDRVTGGYAKTKAEAAQAVLDAAAAGLDAVIVLPSGILGPYDEGRNHLVQMAAEFMSGRLTACVSGGYDFVDVRDVADGCLRAADRGRKGETYILSGRYVQIRRLLGLVGRACGRGEPPALPMWLAEAAVPLVEAYAALRRQRPLYTRYSLHTLRANSSFSWEKAARELGYAPRDIGETVADMVAWLRNGAPAGAGEPPRS